MIEVKADLARAIQIVESLPMLRRYGGEQDAVNELGEILKAIREKIR
jgi:hypothetical protein